MISPEIIKEYNDGRSYKSSVCHAPLTNLRFYQSGDAFACALNAPHILGTYPQDTVKEMWFGARANQLREALKNNDMSLGCCWCRRDLESRYYWGPKSTFDHLMDLKTARFKKAPFFRKIQHSLGRRVEFEYPVSIEFSLSNVCNLECVMCQGFFSSAICRNRENREPSTPPYDLAFIDQVEEFLPHLSIAQFSGGEPFLIDLHYEVWDRIRRLNPGLEIHITTNGTVLNQRVKSVLENMNCHLILSIDSVDKDTYQEIRRNASFDQVMRNTEYFMDYSARRGHSLTFGACVMKNNWQQIPQLLEYCNRRRIVIWFNMVYAPLAYSLSTMKADELKAVLDFWRSAEPATGDWLTTLNRERFLQAIARLDQWLKDALHRESISPLDELAMAGLQVDGIDPHHEMDQVFSQILTVSKCSAQDELKIGQDKYLYRKLADLTEKPFMDAYFHALGAAYKSVDSELETNMLSRIDRFHHRFKDHYGLDSLVMVLVETDIRDVFEWLEGNPPEMMRRFLDNK